MKLVIPAPVWTALRGTLRADGKESAGIMLAHVNTTGSSAGRLLVREIHLPQPNDYREQESFGAVLSPAFVASVVRQARDRQMSVVFFHTHPFADYPEFSPIDDAGERPLLEFVERRVPGLSHAALVLGQKGQAARSLGSSTRLRVEVVGSTVDRMDRRRHSAEPKEDSDEEATEAHRQEFDRQVRVFGAAGQQRLSTLRVAVVGVGGTGSVLTQQLTHLGVTDFLLIDPDIVEPTNLNRVAGAAPNDVGRSKVDVAADMVRRIQPGSQIEAIKGDIVHNSVLQRMSNVDVIFCCTDSHGSRYVLNEFVYRFLVPCFDCGVVIAAAGGTISHIAGRVQMLAPGLSCLTCTRVLDPEQVRRDLLNDFERAQDPYIIGGGAPQPAVMSLNGVVVSLMVTMFLAAFTGIPVVPRYQLYDAMRGTVRAVDTTPIAHCITCSSAGALATGDSWPLPGRSG